MKTILVDDEAPARDELKFLLSQWKDIQIVAEYDSAEKALSACMQSAPDLIFLDVQMRGMNGMDAARMLRRIAPQMMIVFSTAYDEYAVEALEMHAAGYLLKPLDEDKLRELVDYLRQVSDVQRQEVLSRVDQVLEEVPMPRLHKLALEHEGRIYLVNYSDILYVQAQEGRVVVAVVGKNCEYEYHGSMAEIEAHFQGLPLYRVHRSYIVNLEQVQEVLPWFKGTYWLRLALSDGKVQEIPVSKQKVKDIKKILGID
jgi:two-component system LytT family response regulator/two-component system response regulator LytT